MGRNSTKKTPKKVGNKESTNKKYIVEKILDKRYSDGTLEFLIKWKNYSNSENSWEPADNCDCPELIEKFENEQKSKASGKKRGASTGASQNPGPSAKRSRTSAPAGPSAKRSRTSAPVAKVEIPRKRKPYTRNRTVSASEESDDSSASVKIINPRRSSRSTANTPKLVKQQVSFDSPISPNTNTSDVIAVLDSEASDADSSRISPGDKPVVERDSSVVFVEHEALFTKHAYKPNVKNIASLKDVDKNLRMARELVKCADLFYVYISLEVLQYNLYRNHTELLNEIQQLKDKNNVTADEVAQINAKVEEVKTIYEEIETKLVNLHPSDRPGHHVSHPSEPSRADREEENGLPSVEKDVTVEVSTPATDTVENKTEVTNTTENEAIVVDGGDIDVVDVPADDSLEDVIILEPPAKKEAVVFDIEDDEDHDVVVKAVAPVADILQDETVLDSSNAAANQTNVNSGEDDGVIETSVPDVVQDETIRDTPNTPKLETNVDDVEESAVVFTPGQDCVVVLDSTKATENETPANIVEDTVVTEVTTPVTEIAKDEMTLDSTNITQNEALIIDRADDGVVKALTPVADTVEEETNTNGGKEAAGDNNISPIIDDDVTVEDEVSGDSTSGSLPELNNIENLGVESQKAADGESKGNEIGENIEEP